MKVCFQATIFDIVLYICLREIDGIAIRPGDEVAVERRSVFRFLRVLRPAFIICSEEKQSIRRAVYNIYTTIPDIMSVLLLLICSILLFGLMAKVRKFLERLSQSQNFSKLNKMILK